MTPYPSARHRLLTMLLGVGATLSACTNDYDEFVFEEGTGGTTPEGGAAGNAASGSGGAAGSTCASDGECAPPNPYCAPGVGVCVQCLADTNCGSRFCDPATHACVDCFGDQHCGSPTPYCFVASGQCVECLADGNCQGGNCDSNHECQ
jgi:hypothetical protein